MCRYLAGLGVDSTVIHVFVATVLYCRHSSSNGMHRMFVAFTSHELVYNGKTVQWTKFSFTSVSELTFF